MLMTGILFSIFCIFVEDMLTYAAPLNFTQHTEVRLHGNNKLECLSNVDVSKNVQIKWFHDEVEVTENNAFFNSTNQLLIIDAEKDSGKYKCKVIDNDVVFSSSSFDLTSDMLRHLRVELPHTQAIPQLKFQVTDARNFHLKCHLASHPPGNLSFLHNGNVIKPNSRITIVTAQESDGVLYELFINEVDISDVGAYHCRASNGFLIDRILSGNIYLKGTRTTWNSLSHFKSGIFSNNRKIGEKSMRIRRSKRNLENSECSASTHWICPNGGLCVPKTECEIYEDCLNFNCEAPIKPDVSINVITHNTVSLSWQANPKSKEFTCIVDTPKLLSQIYQTKENYLVIGNLENNTNYEINIYAANNVGTSADTYLNFKTRRMVPPQSVENAKVVPKHMLDTMATVEFQWSPPVDDGMENKDGKVKYLITSCIHGNFSDCEQMTTNMTSLEFSISYDVLYTFGITPSNTVDQAGPTKYVFYRTGIPKSSSAGEWRTSFIGLSIICLQLAFYVAG